MDGWWKKNPFFVEYVIHESTALFVLAYAITLLVGLVRLGQGEAAWNAWLQALQSPLALVFHLALLVAIAYHTYTWFKIMPITLPPILVDGKKLSPCAIITGGLTAAVVAGLALIVLVWRIAA
jgi:fumarate reductase subunit C